jgi:hypothetical protein
MAFWKPTITPVFEQPEEALGGVLAYRGYQIYQGLRSIDQKRREDEENQNHTNQVINQRPITTSEAGTYIASPVRRNESGSIEERTPLIGGAGGSSSSSSSQNQYSSAGTYIGSRPGRTNETGTREEKTPLIAPGSLSGLSILRPPNSETKDMYHDDQNEEPLDIEEGEQQPFSSSTGMRARRPQTPSNVSDVSNQSDMQDVDLHDTQPQPVLPTQPTTTNTVAGGVAVGGALAIAGAGYVEAANRNRNLPRIPRYPNPNPNPNPPPQPTQPTQPTQPPPPPQTNDPIFDLPKDNDTTTPYQPPDTNQTQPVQPPIQDIEDIEDIDNNMDIDSQSTELVVVKELIIPSNKSTIPALVTGVAVGASATALLFLI